MVQQKIINMKYHDAFCFGKHKGKELRDVILEDAQYVRWCIRENIIDIDTVSKQQLAKHPQRRTYWYCYDDDEASEMDFCLGLSGGGQGW